MNPAHSYWSESLSVELDDHVEEQLENDLGLRFGGRRELGAHLLAFRIVQDSGDGAVLLRVVSSGGLTGPSIELTAVGRHEYAPEQAAALRLDVRRAIADLQGPDVTAVSRTARAVRPSALDRLRELIALTAGPWRVPLASVSPLDSPRASVGPAGPVSLSFPEELLATLGPHTRARAYFSPPLLEVWIVRANRLDAGQEVVLAAIAPDGELVLADATVTANGALHFALPWPGSAPPAELVLGSRTR